MSTSVVDHKCGFYWFETHGS